MSSKKGQQSQDEVDALMHAQSKTNKHKRPKIVSFNDSDGKDGCALHAWATDHTMAECRVIRKQVDNMREQWNVQLHSTFKCQKMGNTAKIINRKRTAIYIPCSIKSTK
jgi:hypothetical protein